MPTATKKLLVKLGEGTSYTEHHLDSLSNSAVVTEFIGSGVTNQSRFVSYANNGAGESFGDKGPPCRTTTVKGLPGGKAIVIKRYGSRGLEVRSVSRLWSASYSFISYHDMEGDLTTDKDGNLAPVSYPLRTVGISWKVESSMDPATAGIFRLINCVNSTNFWLDGRMFPAGTLRFDGADVEHFTHGNSGLHRWVGEFHAMGREPVVGSSDSLFAINYGSQPGWKNEVLVSAADVAKGTPPVFKMKDIYRRRDFSVLPLV